MDNPFRRGLRPFVVFGTFSLVVAQLVGCGGSGSQGGSSQPSGGSVSGSGGNSVPASSQPGGGSSASAPATSSGGGIGSGGESSADGSAGKGGTSAGKGGTSATGGISAKGGSTSVDAGVSAGDVPQSDKYLVAMVQSSKANATDLTTEDVATLVGDAVTQAGGLDFIKAGQTVVLKPNLVTAYTDHYQQSPAELTVNGLSTDWRVVKAVADLVRAKVGSEGKVLVMEGSTLSTVTAYSMLGYNKTNMSAVDEFIALEGSKCGDKSTTELVQKPGKSGTQYWINKRYVEADVVISVPTLKTHSSAGITGSVKNLGIGTTPVGQFSGSGGFGAGCTRSKTAGANSIDHSTPETLGAFIRDYYSIRPADFAVMDGLQGIQHGPSPAFDPKPGDAGGFWEYAPSRMNMRLILAGRNPVAVDTVEALVMKCDPKKVPHLTKLEADGLGTTDISRITLVGKQITDVAKPFICSLTDICPGK